MPVIDRVVGGTTEEGFMNQLKADLGQWAFDEGALNPFADLGASQCRTAVEARWSWAAIGPGNRFPEMQRRLDKVAFVRYEAELPNRATTNELPGPYVD